MTTLHDRVEAISTWLEQTDTNKATMMQGIQQILGKMNGTKPNLHPLSPQKYVWCNLHRRQIRYNHPLVVHLLDLSELTTMSQPTVPNTAPTIPTMKPQTAIPSTTVTLAVPQLSVHLPPTVPNPPMQPALPYSLNTHQSFTPTLSNEGVYHHQICSITKLWSYIFPTTNTTYANFNSNRSNSHHTIN